MTVPQGRSHLDELYNEHNAFLFIPDSEVVFCFVGLVLVLVCVCVCFLYLKANNEKTQE